MGMATMKLTEEVLVLPMDEGVILAQRMCDSVEHLVNPEIEKVWLDEAEKRWHEIEQERVQCLPAEEVMKKTRASLNK